MSDNWRKIQAEINIETAPKKQALEWYQGESIQLEIRVGNGVDRLQLETGGKILFQAWSGTDTATLYVNDEGAIVTPSLGLVRSELAPNETAFTAGEYNYLVRLFDADGSQVGSLLEGVLTVNAAPTVAGDGYQGPWGPLDLGDLNDVASTAPTDGQVMAWAAGDSEWQPVDQSGGGGGGASELSDLTDVADSTPTNRNVLVGDGVDFHSRALVEADISDLGSYGAGDFLADGSVPMTGDINIGTHDVTNVGSVYADTMRADTELSISDSSVVITSGAIEITGTVDGRDLSVDGAKLDDLPALGNPGEQMTVNEAGTAYENALASKFFPARKGSAGTIAKGTPCYLDGYNPSGFYEVESADNASEATMPAVGLAFESIANNAQGRVLQSGSMTGLDTSAYSVRDRLYVSDVAGAGLPWLTTTKPTDTDKVQAIATVTRSNASNGTILVHGASRANDVPNFSAANKFWHAGATGTVTEGAISEDGITAAAASQVSAGEITAGTETGLRHFSVKDVADIAGAHAAPSPPRGHIDGLITSPGSVDADHDIDISAGEVTSLTGELMQLASAITKQLDAAWAVGDDAGGLDTGTIAADTSYHVWIIQRSDTEVVDALLSLSASSPTMPTNYDRKQLVMSIKTDGSGNLIRWTQTGDYVSQDIVRVGNGLSGSTSAVTVDGLLPTGIVLRGDFGLHYIRNGTTTTNRAAILSSFEDTDQAPGALACDVRLFSGDGSGFIWKPINTNTSSEIRYRGDDETEVTASVYCRGYWHPRGKNAV